MSDLQDFVGDYYLAYDQIFRQQLEYCLQPDDAVLLVSSSGNSPNVVEACR